MNMVDEINAKLEKTSKEKKLGWVPILFATIGFILINSLILFLMYDFIIMPISISFPEISYLQMVGIYIFYLFLTLNLSIK